ncbi:larval cuticle protein 1-like [Nymphalis io]|uniref:larval cuticle protein 1-like n=1 Tax=Inachis io TaxID=171585 RepID=UPI0021675BA6|nr:larval cuticle protein 1-like [Nymphalis io]
MKLIIVALAFVAVVAAVPAVEQHPIAILRAEFEHDPKGGYFYNYETENGIQRVEHGEVKEVADEDKKIHPVVVVRGSYSYTDENGKPEIINYVADENGYRPEGDSIPKAPTPSKR